MNWFIDWVKWFLGEKVKNSISHYNNNHSEFDFELPTIGKSLNDAKTNERFNSKLSLCQDITNHVRRHMRYVPDPLLFDHYTKPEAAYFVANKCWQSIWEEEKRLNTKLTPQQWVDRFKAVYKSYNMSFDCDDWAIMYKKLLEISGFPSQDIFVKTLVVPFWMQLTDVKWNHVICVAKLEYNWYALLDTNGLNWVNVSDASKLDEEIMKKFENIYPTDYAYLLDSEVPFK